MPEITQKNFRGLLPGKISAVVMLLAEELKCSPKEALLEFYSSPTYRELEQESSKRWWESPRQLYDDFLRER